MKKPPFSPIRNIINKRICKGWWIQQFRKGMSPYTQRKCRLHHIPIKPVHPAQEITYFWWSVEIFLLHVNYENDGRRWKKTVGICESWDKLPTSTFESFLKLSDFRRFKKIDWKRRTTGTWTLMILLKRNFKFLKGPCSGSVRIFEG